MSKVLQTLTIAGFSCLMLAAAPAVQAQQAKDKLGEFDEIIIKRKGDKDAKVTVEIRDGEILVDGKAIKNYDNPDISVFRRRIIPQNGNSFSFDSDQDGELPLFGNEDFNIRPNKAMLGVITIKQSANGTTVKTVAKGSPAEKAGLQPGDVITMVDNKNIEEPEDLYTTIGEYAPGDKITITYIRNKKNTKVTVTLDERKEDNSPQVMPRSGNNNFFRFQVPRGRQGFGFPELLNNEGDTRLGLSVQDTEAGDGAVVLDVQPGSAAEKAGFKKDDIVTDLAGNTVKSSGDVAQAYRDNKNKGSITATVKRNNKKETLTIKIPKKLHRADL